MGKKKEEPGKGTEKGRRRKTLILGRRGHLKAGDRPLPTGERKRPQPVLFRSGDRKRFGHPQIFRSEDRA